MIKFFSSKERLEDFLGGKMYCNTPEYFRMNPAPGISDKNEAVAISYREERDGQSDWEIQIDGHPIEGISAYTFTLSPTYSCWLHSWMVMTVPDTREEFEELVASINRIRGEFGVNYAAIPGDCVQEFKELVEESTDKEVHLEVVKYSPDMEEHSIVCKRIEYKYQKEIRFLIGECKQNEMKPHIFKLKKSFEHLAYANAKIEMINPHGHFLCLDGAESFYSSLEAE